MQSILEGAKTGIVPKSSDVVMRRACAASREMRRSNANFFVL